MNAEKKPKTIGFVFSSVFIGVYPWLEIASHLPSERFLNSIESYAHRD